MATAGEILFGLGIAVSLVVAYSIARFTKRRSSEIHSHHLLVLSAVINLLACCFVAFLASVSWMVRAAISAEPDPVDFLLLLPFAVPGVAVVLAYAHGARRIRKRYALDLAPRPLTRQVEELASHLGLPHIGVYVSDRISAPFVFGQVGSPPSVAVPARCEILGKEAKVVLLHELSHILNKDTVFTTGAGFLIPRLKFLLLLALPLGLAMGLGAEAAALLAHLSLLYAYCAISFFVLFCAISRGREMLADITVAQFAGTSEASSSLLEVDLEKALSVHSDFPQAAMGTGRYFQKAERWLNDKALFGKARAFWGGVRRVLTYLFSAKSEHRVRTQDLLDANRGVRTELVPTKESAFWIGFAIGTFLALLFIGCQIWEKMVAEAEAGEAFGYLLHISFALSFPLTGVTTCLFSMPAWSEHSIGRTSLTYVTTLAKRYKYFLLGTLPSFVLLRSFWVSPLERDIAVLAQAIFVGLLIAVSAPITLMSIVVYQMLTTRSRRLWSDLACLGYHQALPHALAVIVMVFGGWHIVAGSQNVGWGLMTGLFGGYGSLLIVQAGRFSRENRYLIIILRVIRRTVRFEFGKKGLAWLNVVDLLIVMTIGLPVGCVVYLIARFALPGTDRAVGSIILLSVMSFILLLLALTKRGRFTSDHGAYVRETCVALSSMASQPSQRLGELIAELGLRWQENLSNGGSHAALEPPTVEQINEMVSMVLFGGVKRIRKDEIADWIIACEGGKGGFGMWPGSRPRLSMTCLALESLQSLGCLAKASHWKHGSWIQGLRKDGFFRDPLARREPWEDTFFAIKSLVLMGKLDLGNDDEIVRTLESSLWQAVQKGDMEAVWYCLESLSLLGRNERRPAVEELLRRTALNLPIANPIYAARTIRSVIEAARIVLPSPDDVAALFPEDFPERLMSALEKELEPVVKRLRRKAAKKS